MSYRLSHIDAMSMAIVCCVLYAVLSLVVVLIFLVAWPLPTTGQRPPLMLLVFLPLIYAVAGFLGGLITAFLYNLVAGWTGGVLFTLQAKSGESPRDTL